MNKVTQDTEREFMEIHMKYVWLELQTRFGFNMKFWKAEFNTFLEKEEHKLGRHGAFFVFGNTHINPVLNQILGRRERHGTFNMLVDYIVKNH